MRAMWHVYYGTRGTAGAYVDALLSASHKAKIKSYAFVSSHYAFKTRGVIKYFFPITDSTEKRNKSIRIVRGFELAMGYLFIWLAALVARPVINLHMVDRLITTIIFFCACKLVHLRVYVTCHDVYDTRGRNLKVSRRWLYVLLRADKLVVHSSASRRMLLECLGDVAAERIVQYPFPFSSYDSILSVKKMEQASQTLNNLLSNEDVDYFLFIGIVRQSKGIDTLLDAWKISACKQRSRLLIAGKWANVPEAIKDRAKKLENCVVLDRYLTDEEFVHFIMKSKFVILPYLDYAHSSVLISCAKHNGTMIISDIDLFKDFLRNYDLTFPRGNSESLAALLDRTVEISSDEIRVRKELLKNSVKQHDRRLVEEIANAYGR